MNSEEFAPFESIGPGSVDAAAQVARGKLDVVRVLVECVTLTVRTSPQWIAMGLLSSAVMALISYLLSSFDTGRGSFLSIVMMLFLVPATLAGYYQILLASKRNERLSFVAALGFGLGRCVRMLATGMVLNLAFWILYTVVAFTIAGLCANESGAYLGFPLGMLCLIAAVYYCLRWQLAAVVCVLENRRFFQVLQRSYALSEGRLGSLTLAALGSGLLCGFAIYLASMGAEAIAFNTASGAVQYVVVAFLYLLAGLLPITANFLGYFYLTAGGIAIQLPAEASDDSIGLSRD